jgi:hypothetical protein
VSATRQSSADESDKLLLFLIGTYAIIPQSTETYPALTGGVLPWRQRTDFYEESRAGTVDMLAEMIREGLATAQRDTMRVAAERSGSNATALQTPAGEHSKGDAHAARSLALAAA